jgi:glycosyltransferase involved in cell wall biosynthesis
MNLKSETNSVYSLSIVVPFYNEAGNSLVLIEEIHATLEGYHGEWEFIAINDGSSDSTQNELERARELYGNHICILNFARNFGQSAAIQAGINASRGALIITMDGDRQNDPSDIPRMITHLIENDLDMVSGWRLHRQDNTLSRLIPSWIANQLIRTALQVNVHDYGCSLKLYRATVIKRIVLMGEMHRFISAWVASVTSPNRIGEMVVNHRARTVGESKYGISRTLRVILDLISMLFFLKWSRRPGHFFGQIGLAQSVVGTMILTWLALVKFVLNEDIGTRPMLFVGIMLVLAGIQFISTGVLAEMLTRQNPLREYPLKEDISVEREWHEPN